MLSFYLKLSSHGFCGLIYFTPFSLVLETTEITAERNVCHGRKRSETAQLFCVQHVFFAVSEN